MYLKHKILYGLYIIIILVLLVVTFSVSIAHDLPFFISGEVAEDISIQELKRYQKGGGMDIIDSNNNRYHCFSIDY